MKKHEAVESNLLNGDFPIADRAPSERLASPSARALAVKSFLSNEKVAIQKIMDGARKKIALERRARETVEAELASERKRSELLYEELTAMRDKCEMHHVSREDYEASLIREEQLSKVLMRQQVRALFHILNNIEMQRNMHFFSKWRQWTNNEQTLAAAEDLRRMTEVTFPASAPNHPLALFTVVCRVVVTGCWLATSVEGPLSLLRAFQAGRGGGAPG